MAKEALENVLENEVATETKTSKKREVTAEEIQGMREAVEFVKTTGFVSEKAAKILELVPMWHDTEANKDKKAEVAEFFGGTEQLKDYIDSEFVEELMKVKGLSSLGTVGNTIKHFYARRSNKRPSKATVQVNINGTVYSVSKVYMESLKDTPNAEKKELLLAHSETKVSEIIQAL